MINRIRGNIREKKDMSILLDVAHLTYEIAVPPAVMVSLDSENTELFVYHYYKMDQSKGVPVLIGFNNEIEKEFFEYFITVSGIGPKAACKALSQPFSLIADWIARADVKMVKSLPGIGERKAKEIIAKLQDKIGKFGLIQDKDNSSETDVKEDVKAEALAVLMQLQYKKNEAKDMIDKAVSRNDKIISSEELLNEVYKQKQVI